MQSVPNGSLGSLHFCYQSVDESPMESSQWVAKYTHCIQNICHWLFLRITTEIWT